MVMNGNDVFAQLFDIGKDILVTFRDSVTNVLLAQIGDSTNAQADSDSAEIWQQTGFSSRAAKPTSGQPACQTLILKRGKRDIIFATRDTRDSSIIGKMAEGETCVFAPGGQNRTLYKADGSIWNITTLGNAKGGTMFAIQQGSDGSYTIQAPAAIFQISAAGAIKIGNAGGGITIDPAGNVNIFGTAVHVQASAVAAISGEIATQLGPIPTVAALGVVGVCYGSTTVPAPTVGSKNVVCSP